MSSFLTTEFRRAVGLQTNIVAISKPVLEAVKETQKRGHLWSEARVDIRVSIKIFLGIHSAVSPPPPNLPHILTSLRFSHHFILEFPQTSPILECSTKHDLPPPPTPPLYSHAPAVMILVLEGGAGGEGEGGISFWWSEERQCVRIHQQLFIRTRGKWPCCLYI